MPCNVLILTFHDVIVFVPNTVELLHGESEDVGGCLAWFTHRCHQLKILDPIQQLAVDVHAEILEKT